MDCLLRVDPLVVISKSVHLADPLSFYNESLHLGEIMVVGDHVGDDGLFIWVLCVHIWGTAK